MSASLAIQVRKEARALLPWWLCVAVTTVLTGMLARRTGGFPDFRYDQEIWVVMLYALGILAVAAVSIGHELTHGTLSALLVQPVSRLKMLTTKLGVLIPALIALGLVGNAVLFNRYVPVSGKPLLIWGPVITAIGLVPLLTVLTRKPLGGVVFALVVPGVILMVSERLFSLGEGTPVWAITWYGTLAASALGIVALFYRFPRLEAAGDAGARTADAVAAVDASAAAGSAATSTRATPRHWTWLVVKKEVRLQQLTFAVSGLGLLACAAVVGSRQVDPNFLGPTLETLTGMHACFIMLIAGAFSIAEERHMGTLTPQLLQPQAASRQFTVKVFVTLTVAAALALGLPLLFMLLGQPINPFKADEFSLVLVMIFAAAVYASSLTTNGLWALLSTFPVMGVAFAIGTVVIDPLRRALNQWFPYRRAGSLAGWQTWTAEQWRAIEPKFELADSIERNTPIVLAIGAVLLVIYFAARNFRSFDRNRRVLLKQALLLALYAATATIVYVVAVRMARANIHL